MHNLIALTSDTSLSFEVCFKTEIYIDNNFCDNNFYI